MRQVPVEPTLCGRKLSGRRHACVFFTDRSHEYGALIPYLREGILGAERVLSIVASGVRTTHESHLRDGGIPASAAQREGRLVIRDWDETYLKDDNFSADAMREKVEGFVRSVRGDGFTRLRTWGDMGWIRHRPAAIAEVVRYEKMAEEISVAFPDDVFVCSYDVSGIPAALVMALAAIHPVVVFDGMPYERLG